MPDVLAFALVILVVTVTPGADLALVTRATVSSGRGAGWAAAGGLVAGVFVWGVAAGVGLAGAIAASPAAFAVVKYAGAVYLGILGVRCLREARRPTRLPTASDGVAGGRSSAFLTGLWTDVLNPKMAVFYVSILPAFVDPRAPLLPQAALLAAVHAVIGVLWFGTYVAVIDRVRGVLSGVGGRVVDGIAGTALLVLGVRLATLQR